MESADGATWYRRPFSYTPTSGHVVRDPGIMYSGGTFWLTHTNITGSGGSTTTGFDIASSPDAIVWTFVDTWDFTSDISGINRCWAPEPFYDEPNDIFRVYFAVSTDGASTFVLYEVHPTNAGWTTNSTPIVVAGTSLPNPAIDAFMIYSTGTANGPYFLWMQTATNIEIAHSTSPTSGFTMLRTGDWMGVGSGIEGPSVLLASGSWRLYADRFMAGTGIAYVDQSSGDWRSGSTSWGSLTGITAPYTTRHGTVIALSVPVNTVAPVVSPSSGTAATTFSCTTGTWTNSPTSYAYQWQLDGVDIGGATSNTYSGSDPGDLTCIVVATNAGGDSDPETSNTAVVSEGGGVAALVNGGLVNRGLVNGGLIG